MAAPVSWFVHIPKFEEFLAGRHFEPETLALMKEAWNAAAKSADLFMEDRESFNYGIAEGIHVE